MTLIRDLIDLPEQVHRGDFVLRLSEGVERPEETLRQYVVTPQLASCFDAALGFVKSALSPPSSKASYLHGSFGSGKSHFMAVLHLLLQQHAGARSVPELAPLVAKHDDWLRGKRFLLVPYHMIGARSMESALLGHYAEHVARLHPDAPVPGVYLAERIFKDADALRRQMGDDAFFARLGEGAERSGWGDIEGAWTSEGYAAACAAAPHSEPRARLVGALVKQFFSAYQSVAMGTDEAFVSLDEGLSIVSQHARALGYDAVVLFLDELILWLASHAADLSFLQREGQKLAKLVEAQSPHRPVPIVSFVARQRDLRELVGEHVAGAEQLGFADVLKYWEARFHTITLEDRNLPAIAEKRVLRPRSEAARQELDRAFAETAKVREEVMTTLLTSAADRDMFRRVYPFSPALVQVLVAVSGVLQRERTALKVMLLLLVSQRDRLQVGDVVPVGDLFDVIAEGDEAFTEAMRRHFENAQRLYEGKLLPLLESQHGLTRDEVRAAVPADPRAAAFRGDDRLVKTLLLAALVPEVEALRALTAGRLAALNHGTIRSPIPGQESQIVLSKLRQWAAQVGEIRIGEEPKNPTVQIQLSGVDTESILDKARVNDNFANRLRRVRALLFADLGLEEADELFVHHEFRWRGTLRRAEVVFANVRELPDDILRCEGSEWRVVIDYPFDEAGHTPKDDLARVQRFEQLNRSSRTLVWLPAFFSPQTLKNLGTFTVLDHVLTGERFSEYASHLSAVDRTSARALLDNQRSQLRQQLRSCLEAAYAVAPAIPGAVDPSHFAGPAEQFLSLEPTFRPQPPVGAGLGQALRHLLDQALAHQFPAHPGFEIDEIRPVHLRKAWEEISRALETEEGRIGVEKPQRQVVRQIANPLRVGTMHETHFVLDQWWKSHFLRLMAEQGLVHPTVGQLRAAFDRPQPMGLPREIQNLVIKVFAGQTHRSFYRRGGLVEPELDGVTDDLELREQILPAIDVWDRAVQRAAAIFGIAASPLRSGASVGRLEDEIRSQAQALHGDAVRLVPALRTALGTFGVSEDTADRLRTATAGLALCEVARGGAEGAVVGAVAAAECPTSDQALGKSLKSAGQVLGALGSTNWEVFEGLGRLSGERHVAGAAIRDRVGEALRRDELAVALGEALRAAQSDALRLLVPPALPPVAPVPVAPAEPLVTGRRPIRQGTLSDLDAAGAQPVLQDLDQSLRQDPRLRLRLTFELYEP